MAKKDNDGNWLNASGQAVPAKYVPKQDKLRDKLVERQFANAVKLHDRIAKFKAEVAEAIDDYLTTLFDEFDVEPTEGGNYTLTNFSGDIQVAVKVQRYHTFDERIEAAKKIVDECLDDWSQGANDNLRVIVNDAFRVHDKRGLDVKAILTLRNYKIKDKTGRWSQAMELIGESLKVTRSRAYLQFRRRPTIKDDWETVPLDIAAVD